MMSWRRSLSGEVISIKQVTAVAVSTVITHIHFTVRGCYCFVPLPSLGHFLWMGKEEFWLCEHGGRPAVEVKIRGKGG